MFLGNWLSTGCVGYVRRVAKPDDKWKHWRVALVRERYSDCALVHVKCIIIRARREQGQWLAARKPETVREVYLGNTNFDSARMRTVHEKAKNDRGVLAELRSALSGITRHIEIAESHELGFRDDEIDLNVILACLKAA
jgi:hypothetical protein